MSVKYKDYYAVLDLEREASESEIKKAYRKLARKYHPDVNQDVGAQERFQEISEAYEVLGDPEKRKRYDELGANWRPGQEFTPPPGWENVHFDFRGNSGGGHGFSFSGHGGFSDFFESIFGDMMGSARHGSFRSRDEVGPRPSRRTHDEADLTLTLEEAFRGVTKRLQLQRAAGGPPRTCNLRIPPGTRDGAKLRLRNQGHDGDLLIRICIAPHPRFRISGADLETDVEISPPEAVLGANVMLPLVEGRVSWRIPPGTQPGQKFRLTGKGLKKPGGGRGDLYAVARVVVPRSPSSRERALYVQLDELSKGERTP